MKVMKTVPELREVWDYGRNGERSGKALYELALLGQVGPDEKPMVWGTVVEWHRIGDYVIAESEADTPVWSGGRLLSPEEQVAEDRYSRFHSYIGCRSTGHGHRTLQEALAFCIAYEAEGPNTRAHSYFLRGLDRS